jgi:hypothetical protein
MDEREAACSELLEVLPPKWRTGRPSFDPAAQLWEIVAIGPKHGGRHGPPPESVTGRRVDEAAAVRDLVDRVSARTSRRPD